MLDILADLQSVAVGLLGTGLLTLLGFIWRKRSAGRRWGLTKPESLKIVLSSSATQDTGEYQRPATGIGQVKALALLSPSLVRAHRSIDLQGVVLSNDHRGTDLEGDLLLLGGPKTNEVTKQALDELAKRFGVTQEESVIHAGDKTYSGESDGTEVSVDYGIVIRAASPFAENSRVVVLSGSHTYGTIGAARYFAKAKLPRGAFAAVIKSKVVDEHALEPELVWKS